MLELFHNTGELVIRHDQGVLDPNCHADTEKFHGGIGSLDLLRALRDSRQRQRPPAGRKWMPSASCLKRIRAMQALTLLQPCCELIDRDAFIRFQSSPGRKV